MSAWSEVKHPRDPLGRFAFGVGFGGDPHHMFRDGEEVGHAFESRGAWVGNVKHPGWGKDHYDYTKLGPYRSPEHVLTAAEAEYNNRLASAAPEGVDRNLVEFGKEHGVGYPQNARQAGAQMAYTTDPSINQYLRGDTSLGGEEAEVHDWEDGVAEPLTVAEAAAEMDAQMKPSERRMTLYRGFDPAILVGLAVGDELTDDAFMSTSTGKEDASIYGRVLTLDVPAGTPAAAGFQDHQEIVLGRGQRLKITKIGPRSISAKVVKSPSPKPPTAPPGTKESKKYGSTTIETKERTDGSLEITSVYTYSSSRGQGAGTAAMRSFLAEADRAGRTVKLVPEGQDQRTKTSKLKEWYRSLGFSSPTKRGDYYWTRGPQ
jgi:ribosomal protein S18 acetylase RimI-like enzyme